MRAAVKMKETAASLAALQELMQDDLNLVNQRLLQELQSEVTLIPELARHLIAAGGKRLRPLLTLASAKLCGHSGSAHIVLATAVEFIHTATLLHDDVVDHSSRRRGLDTANAIWGNKASVLVGDFLFSRAFALMVEAGSLAALDALSKAAVTIATGEVHQLLTANNITATEKDYAQV
ncbi:MAG: polyprenyl synthetase family protein, partial [Dongiaceae bacterium]